LYIEFKMVESIIYLKQNGVSINEIIKLTNLEEEQIKKIIQDIEIHYISDDHGVELVKVLDKYRFEVKPEIKLLITKKPKKIDLSEAQFEILAILFLNGPSRMIEIEKSRGKNCYNQVRKLLEYGLIKKVKKRNSIRNFLYTLSEKFYEWIPQTTLNKLEEMKNDKIAKSSSESGNEQEKSM